MKKIGNQTGLFLLLFLLLFPVSAQQSLENRWGMVFVRIPAGEFKMGLDDYESALMEIPEPGENALRNELPQHTVRITRDFYIGQTEVTQWQWLSIMENRPGPAEYWQQPNWRQLPVVEISWQMASRFVEEINKMDKHYRYRLPTEAEWEYVARAGSDEYSPVPLEELEDYAWFINNSGDEQQPVATRKANAFGVYDMLGNVWEWVSDWYAPDAYSRHSLNDPTGPPEGTARVRRGGSYHCPVHLVRPGYRVSNTPLVAYDVTGFRLVLEKR